MQLFLQFLKLFSLITENIKMFCLIFHVGIFQSREFDKNDENKVSGHDFSSNSFRILDGHPFLIYVILAASPLSGFQNLFAL